MFSLSLHLFLSALGKEMVIVEKEGGLPVFDTDILNTFLATTEITARFAGKIGAHLPAVEGFRTIIKKWIWYYMTLTNLSDITVHKENMPVNGLVTN